MGTFGKYMMRGNARIIDSDVEKQPSDLRFREFCGEEQVIEWGY